MIIYPISEVIDRISICKIKSEMTNEESCKEELKYLMDGLKTYNFSESEAYIKKLYDINLKMWNMESDIRKCLDEKLGLEEIGRRAILIRENNKIRVSLKTEIIKKTNMGFVDIKINHISD